MYKKPRGGVLGEKEEYFNNWLSRGRVKIEHCFGILKGKWQSLQSIRLLINNAKEYKYCTNWIVACMVLHNLTIDDWEADEWLVPEQTDAEDAFWTRLQVWRGQEVEGKKKRDALRDWVWALHNH